ncbi:MAG: hypothetical protein FJ104_15895 [Deltaproteobacteria bacterium]|nr:hypothetical protein [Deltaproteobacteria bacterium]
MSAVFAVCTVAAVVGAPNPAGATIVKPLTVSEMARRADVVVLGRVVGQTATWNPERTRIYTRTELLVGESLKGDARAGESLTIRQLGGTLDGLVQTVPGNARFAIGEEVVVFLDRDEAQPLHYVIGMAQGKFAVRRSGPTVQALQDTSDLAFVRPSAAGALVPVEAGPASPVDGGLEALKHAVRVANATP